MIRVDLHGPGSCGERVRSVGTHAGQAARNMAETIGIRRGNAVPLPSLHLASGPMAVPDSASPPAERAGNVRLQASLELAQEDVLFANSEELLRYLKNEGVKFVDVRFCDLPGVMQYFTVPVESFDENVFTDGLAFDGSSIRGFQQIHESDMLLLPDVTTAFIDPFRVEKTLALNFFIHDPFTREAYSPRPAQRGQEGRGLPGLQRHRGHRLLRRRGGVLHLRLDPPLDAAPTRRSTTSTRSRAAWNTGARATRRAATAVTSPATRAATSRSRRPTTTPTCATRW